MDWKTIKSLQENLHKKKGKGNGQEKSRTDYSDNTRLMSRIKAKTGE